MRGVESWKPVLNWESVYEVSDFGRVRRIKPYSGSGRYRDCTLPRLLKAAIGNAGYPFVELNDAPRRAVVNVHKLVALAFLGPYPDGCEINHKDRNRSNAAASNLEYVSHSENVAHSYTFEERMATVPRGMAHSNRRVDEDAVRFIRSSAASLSTLARKYGVGRGTIFDIRNRKTWRHV